MFITQISGQEQNQAGSVIFQLVRDFMRAHQINLASQVFFGTKIEKTPEAKAAVWYLMRLAIDIPPLVLPENKRAVRLFSYLYAERF